MRRHLGRAMDCVRGHARRARRGARLQPVPHPPDVLDLDAEEKRGHTCSSPSTTTDIYAETVSNHYLGHHSRLDRSPEAPAPDARVDFADESAARTGHGPDGQQDPPTTPGATTSPSTRPAIASRPRRRPARRLRRRRSSRPGVPRVRGEPAAPIVIPTLGIRRRDSKEATGGAGLDTPELDDGHEDERPDRPPATLTRADQVSFGPSAPVHRHEIRSRPCSR